MTWDPRLDIVEALEAAGWTGIEDRPLEVLQHPSGAVWGVINDCGDSGLDCPGAGGVDFPSCVPAAVVVAACLAAAGQHIPGVDQAAALDRVREVATRARMVTSRNQAEMVTARAIGDTVLRALDGADLPTPRVAGETWPPPVIGTAPHTRPPTDGRALVADFRTHVLGESTDG
ncbi:hypothetical protein OG216_25870 [Streptomycetaceae bacterium NBC_01309]